MFRRAAVAGLAVVGLLAAPAQAATPLHGRGPGTQAAMDVQVLQRRGTGPVQVLNQVCEKPSRVSRCTPISSTLQRSLEVAIHRSIVWVDHRRTKGPEFWVFAPVTFGGGTASAEYAFWDPGALGCFGGSSEDWALRQGAWSPTIASAWVGCPAT